MGVAARMLESIMSHPIVENVVIIGADCAGLMATALAVSVAESFLSSTVIAVGLSTLCLLLPRQGYPHHRRAGELPAIGRAV